MHFADSAARNKGFTVKHFMSHEEANANACYYRGESALADFLPNTTTRVRTHTIATMNWVYLAKYSYKKRGQAV